MRVLILLDELFASRERAMLTRLEVGLADEGVRVVHAVPGSVLEHTPGGSADLSGVFSRVITYTPNTMAITRRLTVRRLRGALDELVEGESVDVVHVYGGGAWALGAGLAAELEAALVIEVWRAGLVERARGLRGPEGVTPLFIASDPALERALAAPDGSVRAGGPGYAVRTVLWGVLAPPAARTEAPADRPLSVMIIGNGRDAPAWSAALRGLAMAGAAREMLIFCDSLAAQRAGVWPLARELGLLDRLSLIEELEGRRELVLSGDVLVLPEAHGEQRSVVLEAMAGGMTVVAAEDPMSSMLRAGETAVLAANADAGSWGRALSGPATDPVAVSSLRESAHRHVRTHRRASDHVRGVLAAYEWLAAPDAIPFKPA